MTIVIMMMMINSYRRTAPAIIMMIIMMMSLITMIITGFCIALFQLRSSALQCIITPVIGFCINSALIVHFLTESPWGANA